MIMKLKIQLASLSLIVFFLSLSAALTSCNEDAVPANIIPSSEYFKILGDTLIIPGDATTGAINVTADCGWSATISDKTGWSDLDLETQRGEGNGTISLSTEANSTPNERKAQLTIATDNGINKALHIKQQPGKVELDISVNELKLGRSGGTHNISVTCNTEWTVSGGSDKIKVTSPTSGRGNGTFTITVEPNNTTEIQEATFTVSAGKVSSILHVTQDIKDLLLYATPIWTHFGSKDGDRKIKEMINIFCNDEWIAIRKDSWIKIDKMSGKNDEQNKISDAYITCENNDKGSTRNTNITFTLTRDTTVKREIFVQQSQFNVSFRVSTSNLSFHYNGGEKEFIIESNAECKVNCDSDWLTISTEKAVIDTLIQTIDTLIQTTVKVKCPANSTGTNRKDTITVTCMDMKHPITVEQGSSPSDNYLVVTPNNLSEFPAEGSTTTLKVESNTTWQVIGGSGESGWCKLTGSNDSLTATGNGSVTVTVDANKNKERRTTNIMFLYANDKKETLSISQQGYVGKEPGQEDNGKPDLTRRGAD